MDDYALVEGEFSAYLFNKESKEEELVYRDTNQLQAKGMTVLAYRLTDEWRDLDPLPEFYTMKASVFRDPTGTSELSQGALDMPASVIDPTMISEADSFEVVVPDDISVPPRLEIEGIFLTPPPGLKTAYRHFGLYTLTTFPDKTTQQTLYAYKYIDRGIAFPDNTGLRIMWKIFITL